MAITLGKKALVDCDLIIVAGCSFACKFMWRVDTGGEPVPADLANATAVCQIREENDGAIVIDASQYVTCAVGEVTIDIPPSATTSAPAGKYPWDIIVTDRFGEATRLAAGDATIVDPISEAD